MNKSQTIFNWRWWLVLPFVLPVFAVISIPAMIIFFLELIVAALEVINVSRMHSKTMKRIVNWVQRTNTV